MPFFNSTHYKSTETPICHSNQTMELIFIKKKKKKSVRAYNYDEYFYSLSFIEHIVSDKIIF